jgi:ferritin
METKRITAKIETALNAQMSKEAYAAQIYLSLGSWAETNGYGGVAEYLYKHAGEERNHMMKILKYINARGGSANIQAISAPDKQPKNLQQVFEFVVAHEFDNTDSIYKLVDICQKAGDWATYNFAQWFVKEQIEEETLVLGLLDKFNLANKTNKETNMYSFDRDLVTTPQSTEIPREASEG